jgi:hypothetical protein
MLPKWMNLKTSFPENLSLARWCGYFLILIIVLSVNFPFSYYFALLRPRRIEVYLTEIKGLKQKSESLLSSSEKKELIKRAIFLEYSLSNDLKEIFFMLLFSGIFHIMFLLAMAGITIYYRRNKFFASRGVIFTIHFTASITLCIISSFGNALVSLTCYNKYSSEDIISFRAIVSHKLYLYKKIMIFI